MLVLKLFIAKGCVGCKWASRNANGADSSWRQCRRTEAVVAGAVHVGWSLLDGCWSAGTWAATDMQSDWQGGVGQLETGPVHGATKGVSSA